MIKQNFRATFLSDVVISQNAATAGGHSSLDYIPGSFLLGVCASKQYRKYPDKAFDLFHNGSVKFGNAYPVSRKANRTFPVPLSWHVPKLEEFKNEQTGKLNRESIFNCCFLSNATEKSWKDNAVQAEQKCDGYFSLGGYYVKPESNYRIKTAINRETGNRPEDEQLFGYESISEGSEWYFSIEFSKEEYKDILLDSLADNKIINIGRSRGAEYGRTQISHISKNFEEIPRFNSSEYVCIYCYSDLVLQDINSGSPTLIPNGLHFAMEDQEPDWSKTFIRSRSYAPFNGKRKCYDLERQMICKGSVIVFKSGKHTIEDLRSIETKGVGMYQQEGFGQVFVNPLFLENEHPTFIQNEKPLYDTIGNKSKMSATPYLAKLLSQKYKRTKMEEEAQYITQKWLPLLMKAVYDNPLASPNKSQWSQLFSRTENLTKIIDIRFALFDETKGLCASGKSKKEWIEENVFHVETKKWISFKDVIERVFDECNNDSNKDHNKDSELIKYSLFIIANQMPHAINQGRS